MKNDGLVEVGKCWPIVMGFLDQMDRVRLTGVSKTLREVLLDSVVWDQVEFVDGFKDVGLWMKHCEWVIKYTPIIKPSRFSLLIYELHDPKPILNVLMSAKQPSVEVLEIYCESEEVHLAASLCFPRVNELIIKSRCVSDQLMRFMCENLKDIHSLTIIKNDMNFSAKDLSTYIHNPMQKLEIKPYLVDFQEVLAVSKASNQSLRVLELDVEECPTETIPQILSWVPKLEILRLYHLQNLQSDQQLLSIIKQQRLREFSITKAHYLPMHRILAALSTPYLEHLDITDSRLVLDEDLMKVWSKAVNLKFVCLSWCNGLSNKSIVDMVEKCRKLEHVDVSGVKELTDLAFGEYEGLVESFNEVFYDQVKAKIHEPDSSYHLTSEFFSSPPIETTTLRNLKNLSCVSCNGISDTVLKVIYILLRKVKVINYYSNDLGLYSKDLFD